MSGYCAGTRTSSGRTGVNPRAVTSASMFATPLPPRHLSLPEERSGHVAPVPAALRALVGRDLRRGGANRVELRTVVGEVVVVLAGVVGLVACRPEQFGNRHHAFRQVDLVSRNPPRAMVVYADPDGVAARNERRPGRAANRRRRIRPLEQHAFPRQRIDVGRLDQGRSRSSSTRAIGRRCRSKGRWAWRLVLPRPRCPRAARPEPATPSCSNWLLHD